MWRTFFALLTVVAMVSRRAGAQAPLPPSEVKAELVDSIEAQIDDFVGERRDDEVDWQGDRARLEMQLATARLEYASLLLVESREGDGTKAARDAVLESLVQVQEADRTLNRIDIERLDDFDRRSFRSLSAMRHRVSSLQIDALLRMVEKIGEGDIGGGRRDGGPGTAVEPMADPVDPDPGARVAVPGKKPCCCVTQRKPGRFRGCRQRRCRVR